MPRRIDLRGIGPISSGMSGKPGRQEGGKDGIGARDTLYVKMGRKKGEKPANLRTTE
jgi:hypothetical protein